MERTKISRNAKKILAEIIENADIYFCLDNWAIKNHWTQNETDLVESEIKKQQKFWIRRIKESI